MHNQDGMLHVAIVGCGLAGLAMALVLQREGAPFNIYEMRDPSAKHAVGGSVTLTPNSLRLLDELGLYERMKDTAWPWTRALSLNEQLEVNNEFWWGSKEIYGYDALRVVRQELIDTMKELLKERGAESKFKWQQKVTKIVQDDNEGVIFELLDGAHQQADVLIGADGIHSTIRHYVQDVPAQYSGYTMVFSRIPTSSIRFPKEIEAYGLLPLTIQAKVGGFVPAPETANGAEMFCLRSFQLPELDHAGWRALSHNKQQLRDMFCKDKDQFPDLVQSAMEAAKLERMGLWPIYTIPKLKSWTSKTGKVVLIGDSAHAIPPAAGQGVNQAFEDAYSLGLLLRNVTKDIDLKEALEFWQTRRQDRLERVRKLAEGLNIARLSEEERRKHANELKEIGSGGAYGEFGWLYDPKPGLEKEFKQWITLHLQGREQSS